LPCRDAGGYTFEAKRKRSISVAEPLHCRLRDLRMSHDDGPELNSCIAAGSVQLHSLPWPK